MRTIWPWLHACMDPNSVSYCQYINCLTSWFDDSSLDLNVTKTMELCIGGKRRAGNSSHIYKPIYIKGQEVEQVTNFKDLYIKKKKKNFKYLGTIIDKKLTFQDNVDYIYKKAWQHLALLRKLRSFNTSQRTFSMVSKSLIESVLTFNIISWYGNLSVKQKNKPPLLPAATISCF